ncbi:MAG: AbrB/MazE/SpoVT family DNA-binding domain-containing protein [Deltaproteobacteria bacterium]|nr:AbrB/MazE/SpoVT family DNA-binding domain-containing protein [Candidatus Deferrimicrobium borealis]
MRARIRRWGNSLALRIPKAFAEEASLEDESVVDLKVVNGKLVVASVVDPEVSLDRLLADVEDRNLHGEVSTGRAVRTEGR